MPANPFRPSTAPEMQHRRELHDLGWPAYIPMLRLTCRPGTPQQKTWQLRSAVSVIGSKPSAHVRMRGDAVSRTHAAIICDGTEPILCDLVSSNGTFHRGQRIRWAILHDNDTVQIGDYEFCVQTQPHPGSRGKMYESGQFQAARPRRPLRLVNDAGRDSLQIAQGIGVVGSRAGSDLIVPSFGVSPTVAILLPWQSEWAVYDLAADEEPQTQVNGQSVLSAVLKAGDTLAFNGQAFRVVLGASPPARTPIPMPRPLGVLPPQPTPVP